MLTFVAIKYLSLVLTATRSFALASLLGPQSYGLLGTMLIIQQYLSYTALGMREGLTVLLARDSIDKPVVLRSTALAWALCVGFLIITVILVFSLTVQPLDDSWLWVGIISLLSIFNEILINIHRDLNRIKKVAILEVLYNIAPLACVLIFGNDITVVIVLQSIAIGLVFSIAGFLSGLTGMSWHHVSISAARSLLATGIPLAVTAFFSASVTSIYVLLANAMKLGAEVGLIVFANSVCLIVLFGSNAVAWGATSRSMRGVAGQQSKDDLAHNLRLTYFFRVTLVASVLAISLSGTAVAHWLPAYSGMEHYALLFCLLQSTPLLLYVEMNFLSVNNRSLLISLSYASATAVLLIVYLSVPDIRIVHLLNIGIVLTTILGSICAVFCLHLGLRSASLRSQQAFLLYPPACMVLHNLLSMPGVILVSLIFLSNAVYNASRVYNWRGART